MSNPWKVINVELSKSIPDLPLMPGYGGIYTVFWWHNIPLGQQEILAAQLPMSATELTNLAVQAITPTIGSHLLEQGFKAALPVISKNPARDRPPEFQALMALEQPLAKLEQHFSHLNSETVSVVICTRNRPEQLERCLQSFQKLSHLPHEIIVVDNAPSSDATQQLVAKIPEVKYVLEPRPGLSVARNTGIDHSTGNIIAFTDDDVIVHPDWIARIAQSFQGDRVIAMTGLILPAELENEAQLIFQKGHTGFGWGYRPTTFDTQFFDEMKPLAVPVWRIGAGANMAFRRELFDKIGYFDERLGAGASGCSEDSEMWYRVLAEGGFCRYEPTAVVYHYHRGDLDSLKHQMYHYMRGHIAALFVQFERYKHWGNLRRVFIALPRYYVKRFIIGVLTGFRGVNKTLFSEVLGCLAGVQFYIQNQSNKN
ncbi:glycosyltransferase family 2 protein [Microcoleus vaginatus]|uniref:glycosyltransferase family 2 protein n=1 Tax=Microcoleus vaginatus TaxID=119532 RepID=UPI0032A7B9D1